MANGEEEKLDKKIQPRKMQAGEFESYKAFEETAVHNIKLCVAFSNETRKIVKELKDEVKHLKNIVANRDQQIGQMQKQLGTLLQNKFNEGT